MITINYLIEFAVLYAYCGFVFCFLRKHTNPTFLRIFILGSLGLSLTIPMLPSIVDSGTELFGVTLPQIVIGATSNSSLSETVSTGESISFSYASIAWMLYFFASIGLFVRLLNSSIKLWKATWRQPSQIINDRCVIYSEACEQPCSFFNKILIPAHHTFTESEMAVILKHESFHIAYGHSYDKLLFEITQVLLWWHPVHYLYKTQLNLIHEYEVDESMLKTMQQKTYQNILLQLVINPSGLRIANQFYSHIKQRISMMYSQKNPLSMPKMITMLLVVIGGLLSIHACAVEDANPSAASNSELESYDERKQTWQNTLNADNDSLTSYIHEVIDTVITFDLETRKETMSFVKSSKLIYKTPESMPTFPGCEGNSGEGLEACSQQQLLQYVYKNLVYPQAARDKGIEGMVVTKFIVDENGQIFNLQFVKSPDPSLEASVATMFDKMSKEIQWTPGVHQGKNVNTEYILPVKFKLN